MVVWIIIVTAIFLISLIATYCYQNLALQKSILDLPNSRSLHQQPTPRGAGAVFVMLFYLQLFLLWHLNFISLQFFMVMLGGIPIACVGFLDDVITINIKWRALTHISAAIWGIAWLGLEDQWIALFAIFLTVWFVNLYNFMDGIDGLAASEGIFVSVAAALGLLLHGAFGISLLCFGLAAALLGFLVWNWAPAKVFMGDVGSGFLGYCFAMMMWSSGIAHTVPVLFWWILLAIFLTDATYTLIYRFFQKKQWYSAHREHVYQRLVAAGFRHHQITLIALGINILILLPAAFYLLQMHHVLPTVLLVTSFAAIMTFFWYYCHKHYPVVRS